VWGTGQNAMLGVSNKVTTGGRQAMRKLTIIEQNQRSITAIELDTRIRIRAVDPIDHSVAIVEITPTQAIDLGDWLRNVSQEMNQKESEKTNETIEVAGDKYSASWNSEIKAVTRRYHIGIMCISPHAKGSEWINLPPSGARELGEWLIEQSENTEELT
jgi:hypothetical protein